MKACITIQQFAPANASAWQLLWADRALLANSTSHLHSCLASANLTLLRCYRHPPSPCDAASYSPGDSKNQTFEVGIRPKKGQRITGSLSKLSMGS